MTEKISEKLNKTYARIRKLMIEESHDMLNHIDEQKNLLRWKGIAKWDTDSLPQYATFLSTEKLIEVLNNLETSSKRLEKLTKVLIGLTIALIIIAGYSIYITLIS